MNFDVKETLKRLCLCCGVSGSEDEACTAAAELLKRYSNDILLDDYGCVSAVIKKPAPGQPLVLLEAHIDEIGMIVTYIEENGFLKVANCGGIDRRLLLAQQVTVHGKERLKGVISVMPPHLESDEERKKTPEIEKIAVDIGMNKESAQRLIAPGDKITFDTAFRELKNDRVSVKAIDDRGGVTAVLYALEMLKEQEYPCGLSVLFSSQEELGERGAAIGGFRIQPDISLSVDVSFGYTSDAVEYKCGKMGQGAMIGIAPSLNQEIADRLIAVAKEADIPYQLEIMEGETSTDADTIGVTGAGVKTGLVSIPIRYMHTPVETVAIGDIEAVGRLLAEYVLRFEPISERNQKL